ncbi:MAG: transposase [Ruminococcaceae bacterium]|nr:transposase [Oscillospiraceae bacterium]
MEYHKRKHPRIKEYDYSQPGYYYVTINTLNNAKVLSTVGRGLAPAAIIVELSEVGKVAERQLLELEKRYNHVRIDKYVIMPNHIHVIFVLNEQVAGASPRPTLMDVVCAYKSITTCECNRMDNTPGRKLFQASFYDTVIRNDSAYYETARYIEENPLKWMLDKEGMRR